MKPAPGAAAVGKPGSASAAKRVPAQRVPPPAPPAPEEPLHPVLFWLGAVVFSWGGVVVAIAGVVLTPFRVGGVLVPVSILIAVGGNIGLMWLTGKLGGPRFLPLLPGLVWLAVAFWASGSTGEGDILMAGNNWVAAGYLLTGSATVGIVGYRLVLRSL